jgi:hypothetical protein
MLINSNQMLKSIIIGALSLALIFASYKSVELISESSTLKLLKEDQAEINKINYGLFNIQIWKKEALYVFENRIQNFRISEKAYDQVVIELRKYLYGINKEYIESGKIFENIFAEAEKSEKINKVFLKLIKENTIPQVKNLNIPKYIPGMAIQLANELKKQEPQLQEIMRLELKKILNDNDQKEYVDPRSSIYAKYGASDLESTNSIIETSIKKNLAKVNANVKLIYICLLISFILSIVLIPIIGYTSGITLITINSVILLLLGVNLPMIDIEALLNSFTLNVLGTNIGFDKQYMYFQSKSILDVTETLIKGRGLDLKIVGIMILCFSIIFPLFKLVLSTMYLYSNRIQQSKIVQNIIFYLGKWSMADVFVVALFMAYIGFYGIISSQLGSIERNDGGFAVETINNSKLAPGALFFTTYCVFSIIVGIMINKRVEIKE